MCVCVWGPRLVFFKSLWTFACLLDLRCISGGVCACESAGSNGTLWPAPHYPARGSRAVGQILAASCTAQSSHLFFRVTVCCRVVSEYFDTLLIGVTHVILLSNSANGCLPSYDLLTICSNSVSKYLEILACGEKSSTLFYYQQTLTMNSISLFPQKNEWHGFMRSTQFTVTVNLNVWVSNHTI